VATAAAPAAPPPAGDRAAHAPKFSGRIRRRHAPRWRRLRGRDHLHRAREIAIARSAAGDGVPASWRCRQRSPREVAGLASPSSWIAEEPVRDESERAGLIEYGLFAFRDVVGAMVIARGCGFGERSSAPTRHVGFAPAADRSLGESWCDRLGDREE
jgi:hypothetical protein